MRHHLYAVITTFFVVMKLSSVAQMNYTPESTTITSVADIFSFGKQNAEEQINASPSQANVQGKIPMDYRRFYSVVNNQFNGEFLFDNDTISKYTAGGGLLFKNFEAFYEFPDEMNVMVSKFRLFDDQHAYLDHPLTISIIRRSNAGAWVREFVGTFNGSLNKAWLEIPLSSPADVKYIVFTGAQWDNFPTELEAWGTYTPYQDVVPSLPRKKFKNYFGVNVYEWNLLQDDVHPFVGWKVYEPKWDILKHYTHYRHYLDWGQIEGDEGKYSFQPTRMGAWFYDVFYERMSSGGRTITPCIKALPSWMEATWPADKLHHENVPVKYPLSYDSVSSYLPIAKTYYQFAARYGSTKVDTNLLTVYSPPGYQPQQRKSGLGYIKVMEAENERDKWWHGIEGYQSGRQYAAFLSAIYDGHMGALGKGVGIKAADPTMKLIIGGTANPLPDYARGIIDWCKQYRRDSLPFDDFTYHDYASNGSTSQFNADATSSKAPELSALGKNADNYIFTIGAFAKNKGRGLINSEFGIDIDPSSTMKAVAIGNRSVLQTQGDWTIRTILLYARKRLDRIYDFQFFDNIENSPGLFGTTGVANTDLTKRPVLDYVEQMNKLLGEYEYDQTIASKPEVDKYTLGQSAKYVLWMGTETGATATYRYILSNPSNKVKVYELADGQSDMIQSYAPVSGGIATIQVTETPKVIEEVSAEENFAPPLANAGIDQVITLPTSEVVLSGDGSSDAGAVTYTWSKVAGPNELTGKVVAPYNKQTDILYLSQGYYLYQLKVTDVTGKTALDTVAITVNNAPGNQPPVALAGNDTIVVAPTTSFELNGTASYDPDGTIKKYKWKKVAGPSWGILQTPETAKLMCMYAEPGTVYMFDLMVTDDKGATATDRKVVITLKEGQAAPTNTNIGTPPVANAGKDIVVKNGSTASVDGSGSKAALGYMIAKYRWSKLSGPAGYALATPSFNGTAISGLQKGVYVFRLIVTDDKGATATDDVTVTVLEGVAGTEPPPGNTGLPVANAGKDESIPVGQATVLDGAASVAQNGMITGYAWEKISGPARLEMLTPGFSNTWIRNMESGIYVFRLTVTDTNGLSATDDVTITVGTGGDATPPPNAGSAPVANAGVDETIPVGQATVLTGETSSGNISSYVWTKVSGPSKLEMLTPNEKKTWIRNMDPGVYVFRLTVTDSIAHSSSDDVVITVNALKTTPPVANAGNDENIPPGQATVLSGEKSYAPAGVIRSYQWTKVSGPAALEMLTPAGATTWIRNMTTGAYVFRLTITDDKGNSATDDVNITVTTGATTSTLPSGLVANAGKDETIPVGQATVLKGENSLSVTGNITSFSWSKVSGPSQYEMLTPNADRTWIRNMVAGTYVYRLKVTDDKGAVATDDVVIVVTTAAANRASAIPQTEYAGGAINDPAFVIFPNPASQQATLKWTSQEYGAGTIRVIDASDVTVKRINFRKELQQYQTNIDLSALKAGVYIVEIKMQHGKTITQKLVKY